jgi:hypothetical protein
VSVVGPEVAIDPCGDDKVIDSHSANAPHPCSSGPLLSEGKPDNGPTKNPA